MNGFPTTFWAKLERDDDGEVVAWHPLVDHCADVAAVTEALLERTILGRRLAALGGLDRLSRPQVARLTTFAAIHDAGKCNNGFQGRARPYSRRSSMNRVGHLTEILAPLLTGGYGRKEELIDALDLHEYAQWIQPDAALQHFVAAIFSHHGKPVPFEVGAEDWWWEVRDGRDPVDGVAELTAATRRWFPEALDRNAQPLPGSPAFQHAWAGLLMLADWIGSDADRFFPFSEEGEGDRMELARERSREALVRLGLNASPPRATLGPHLPAYEWARAEWPEPDAEPRPAQRRVLDLPRPQAGSVAVLEAATGAGKTEAAIAHFLRLFHEGRVDGMYFALPTRTAATQIHGRVTRAVEAAFPEDTRPPVVLAVPGYLRVDDQKGWRLPEFRVLWNDDAHERTRYRGWAAESSKRYLAGAVAVGTIDQVLLSALAIPHAHLRASALLRHLLVVDEVHASSVYMTRILEDVLDQHVASGGHAFLMSATLGAAARSRLLAPPGRRSRAEVPPLDEAERLPYPAVSFSVGGGPTEVLDVGGRPDSKRVEVETVRWMDAPERIAARALDAARAGARVAIVRNTVGGCRAVQGALEELATGDDRSLLFTCNDLPTPHHSRYSGADRKRLDGAVEQAFGRHRPTGGCVVAATQTIEQSLDLDADLLLTDLAPMDVLLQRIGRLHRHRRKNRPAGFETARVVVLVPEDRNLASLIHPQHHDARGPHGLGPVYEDLRVLEATWRLLLERRQIEVPAENRLLVERSTHPEILGRIVDESGDPWPRHQHHLVGQGLARRRIAWHNRLPRDKGFAEVSFPPRPGRRDRDRDRDEPQHKISARLGELDRLVRFETPPASPFGTHVSELRLPEYWVQGVLPDVEAADDVIATEVGFTFRYGSCLFRYDRWGVAPVEEAEK